MNRIKYGRFTKSDQKKLLIARFHWSKKAIV